ncbi:kinesin-domain-containing protein [Polychaeton citri CBS 116435]|uniref:Kinesin-domain-containing protein n=1 Tax=Polychaeton citri CBS 116435 TaxID=1314669 RepID=A0A9P4QAH1_9PEZI|nr:kinesin-domain-containing protein [Polychaeton citri CBS 116435]
MSVRVVARIRPLLKAETQADTIVTSASSPSDKKDSRTIVRIPNPKNEFEAYSFQFNNVYGQEATQAQIFDDEVAPTVKHLFKGFDVTLFAYGVTGTGKTHTMRGGKSLADRGVIPRMLSSIYRRARKIEKDSSSETQVAVSMSYYEIYNDRVYDLFEPPEKRTLAGLPIRDNNGKTVVCGLTEKPCTTLKEFEQLYDQANLNRSTSATKLNAHSSRSHAVLCVKVSQTTDDETRVSTASAIDLAGSEDNRRTDNNKERLVESASINKSLFVLAQCVEAISKKQARIPYRESKMTRILSLGQNNGLTVMILNLAPVRSYHLDTLSSLNFANRTKKIEVNEIENLPIFRELEGKKGDTKTSATAIPSMNRQPLRPKILSQNSHLKEVGSTTTKPTKSFPVYSDKPKAIQKPANLANISQQRALVREPLKSPKRTSSEAMITSNKPAKHARLNEPNKPAETSLSKDAIEALIARKVSEALAERVDQTNVSAGDVISDEVQKRLEALEKRVEGHETERAEGLQYLLMAKQHQVRGEDASALKMYQLSLPHFPDNQKLVRKVAGLQERIAAKQLVKRSLSRPMPTCDQGIEAVKLADAVGAPKASNTRRLQLDEQDETFHEAQDEEQEEDDFIYRPRTKLRKPVHTKLNRSAVTPSAPPSQPPPPPFDLGQPATTYNEEAEDSEEEEFASALMAQTPRTKYLLKIINTKDVSQIKLLKGVGSKKAEAIVNSICDLDDGNEEARVTSLLELGKLKGVGVKTVENMRSGITV